MRINKCIIVALLILINTFSYSQKIDLKDSISSYSYYNPKPDGYNKSVVFLQNLKPYVNEKDPYYFLYLQYLSEAYEYYGEFEKALEVNKFIQKLATINGVDVTCYAYYKISRIEKLTCDYKNAIKSNRFMLNACLIGTNFEQANQNMGINPDYLRELVRLYLITKQYKNALNMANSLPTSEKENNVTFIKAKLFYEKQQYDSAAYYCNSYSSNNDFIDDYFVSNVYLKNGNKLEAKEYYLKALKMVEDVSWENWKKNNVGDNPERYFSCLFYKNIKSQRDNILKDKKKWGLK